jgi:anthranilate synthase component 1
MTGAGLYAPDRATFTALARDHAVVPVWREVIADLSTPLAVYDRLRGVGGPTFLLESVEQGERWGRYSFLGLAPFATLTARDGGVRLEGDLPSGVAEQAEGRDPLAALEALLRALRAPALPGLPPLHAGAVGYLGWEVVHAIERLPQTGADDLGLDDVRLLLPGLLVAFDHLRQRLSIVANVVVGDDLDGRYDRAVTACEELVERLAAPVTTPPIAPPRAFDVPADVQANMPREDYLAAVEAAKEHIRAGDAFQVVPSHRFALATDVDPLLVYRVLRLLNPSPYMYFFDWGDLQIAGSSPEALVKVRGRQAQIWPIAGSRPRGATQAEDAALEASLLADTKERAEHVMLVDLARNDLGRISELGTVRVDDYASVVRYSHIMHLVSRVQGTVRAGLGPVDVLRATFPAGTLSGAPKVRAIQIIDTLEPTRRKVYGGGIGYVDLAGDLDVCIAIRTLVFSGGCAYVQAGAGIVADSVPETEYAETQAKAGALLAAVRAAEALRDEAER